MDYSALEELGLSTAEAKVYVALLEQGQSTTGRIINHTRMQSSTVYHTLGMLLKKGVISYVYKGKMKFFQAERPEVFLTFLDDQKQKFMDILPELKQKEKTATEHYSAKVYEGMSGLRAAYSDVLYTLKPGDTYYFIQGPQEQLRQEKVTRFYRKYHLQRANLGINVRGLSPPGFEDALEPIWSGISHTEIRLLDEFIPKSMVIYANKVIIIDFTENPVIFMIESQNIADTYRRFCDQKWEIAKKWKSKKLIPNPLEKARK